LLKSTHTFETEVSVLLGCDAASPGNWLSTFYDAGMVSSSRVEFFLLLEYFFP
jgi:hypothetical protein